MSARYLAAFCLLNLVVLPGRAASGDESVSEIVVYFTGAAQPQRPLDFMKLELGRILNAAGYRPEWADSRNAVRPSTEAQLIVMELRGSCTALSSRPPAKIGALASTAISEGQILPFSSIDCANLSSLLSESLTPEPPARRDFLYGRAMARVAAHEIYHILVGTTDHTREGIARPAFAAADLINEHFAFEESTLAKMRPSVGRGAESAGEASAR